MGLRPTFLGVRSKAVECLDANVLQQFIAGSLDVAQRHEVDQHIATCETCRTLVTALAPEHVATTQALLHGNVRVSTARPRKVERYEIAEPLGEGGMGIVYAAYDPELHREVALKLLRAAPGGAGDDTAGARARLLREAQAMARIAHPNVIAVYDVGVWDHKVFVAMELAPKGTLRKWQGVPGREWREIVDAYLAAGKGLAAAHAAGLVHRDFKPDNVLVGADGRMRVTDFGLARAENVAVEPEAAASGMLQMSLTVTGAIMGTPAYMSPEQIDRKPADARSDQFSFCVAMWEALYGRRPFAGATLIDVREAIEQNQVAAPKSDVPLSIQRGLLRGLSAKPEERWPNMDALLEAVTPRRSRRLAIGIGLVVALLVGGAISGLAISASHTTQTCEPPALPITWAARRIAVDLKLPATVVPRLDAWFSSWTTSAATTCQRDETSTRRQHCLLSLLDAADVQLADWEAGNNLVALDAHTAVEDLPRITRCSIAAQRNVDDKHWMFSRPFEVAFANADPPQFQALYADAGAIPDIPLQVRIGIALSASTRDRTAKEKLAREVVSIADRSPAEIPRITSRLQLLDALGADDADEVTAIIETTRRLIAQLGGDMELEAQLEVLVGHALGDRNHSAEAVAAYERARAADQAAYGPDSQREVVVLISLAGAKTGTPAMRAAIEAANAINKRMGVTMDLSVLMAQLDPQAAIDRTKELVTIARETHPEALPQMEINLANAYYNADDHPNALATYELAIAHAEKRNQRDELIANALSRESRLFLEIERVRDATRAASRAVEIAKAIKADKSLGIAYTALGTAQTAANDLRSARASLEQANTLMEREDPDFRERTQIALAIATWPVDHARALDLAHAARLAMSTMIAGEPPNAKHAQRLADVDHFLATHRQ